MSTSDPGPDREALERGQAKIAGTDYGDEELDQPPWVDHNAENAPAQPEG